jgi:hypothetical protein
MFQPGDKNVDLRLEYPELFQIEQFRDLSSRELLYVWHFANRSSPLYKEKDKRIKVKKCLGASFGASITKSETEKYIAGNYPEKVRVAIERMERFSPTYRIRAKQGIKKIFDNLEALINVDTEEIKDMDFAKRKDYVAVAIKVAESLPAIIKQLEEGFGYRDDKDDKTPDNKQPSLMDHLLMEDNEEI